MNKEITVYELLGLVKDNKAPKKIQYQGNILQFDGKDYKFYAGADELSDDSLVKYIAIGNLIDKVEILEEDEDENIKPLETFNDVSFYSWIYVDENRRKINELIEEVNKLRKDRK